MPQKIKKFIDQFSRTAKLDLEGFNREKTDSPIRTILMTEDPILEVDWSQWRMVRGINLMSGVEFPQERQVPMFDSHRIWGTESIVGSMRNLRVEGDKLLADVHLASDAEKQRKLIDEGHLTDVSAGFRTYKNHTVEIAPGSKATVEGREFVNDFGDDVPLIIRTKTTVHEGSLAPIGADARSKLNRSLHDAEELEKGIRAEDPALQDKLDEILNTQRSLKEQISNIKITGGNMPEPTKKPEELAREQQLIEDIDKILQFGRERFKGKFKDQAMDAIRKKTFVEFQAECVNEMERTGGAFETPLSKVGLSDKEIRAYNMSELIDFEVKRQTGNLSQSEKKNRYTEISDHIAGLVGHGPQRGTMFLPYEISASNPMVVGEGKRAHSVGTLSEGGYLVPTELRDDLMEEHLKVNTVLGQMGATVISGLRGNLEMPVIVSSLSIAAAAENTAGSASYMVIGQKTAQPHIITGYTEYGRLLEAQSSISYSQRLIKELNDVKNVKIDWFGINGDGIGNNPLGLLGMSGIDAQTVGAATYRKVMKFRTAVKKANAFGLGQYKWLTSPDVEEVLSTTPKEAGQAIYLMNEEGRMVAAPSIASNQVPDQALVYGEWSQFHVLHWGVDELLINPFIKGKEGMVQLAIFAMVDYFLKQDAAMSISEDVTIA